MTNDISLCIIANVVCADVAHLVERHLAKVEVASSSLVIRSRKAVRFLNLTAFTYSLLLFHSLLSNLSLTNLKIRSIIHSTIENARWGADVIG